MYYLYILKSLNYNRRYIGISGNLEKRIVYHNSGNVSSTKVYLPWKIVYAESYPTKKEARIREIFLKKTAKARIELFAKIDKAPIV